jgi:hypothetical protein
MIVPPPMNLGPTVLGGEVWAPTMQMELIFKGVPTGKEVMCNFISRYIMNGRYEMDGELFDEDGKLVALTRYVFFTGRFFRFFFFDLLAHSLL